MSFKQISIIIIILIILGGCSYFTYKYYFKVPPPLLITNNHNDKLVSPSNQLEKSSSPNINSFLVNYEDTSSQPFFEISIGENYIGKIIFQLFDDDAPKTCKNFRYLCSHGLLNKTKPSYQDTIIHRVIKDFMIQGGDITRGDGTGGYSIYGEQFDDEPFNFLILIFRLT